MTSKEVREAAFATLVEGGVDPSKILDERELEQLRITFSELDENKDGQVAASELRRTLASPEVAPFVTEGRVSAMISESDLDADAEVSLEELMIASATRKLRALEQRAWNTFADFDADADGFVVRSELARLVAAGAAEDDVERVFEAADGDGDEKIDYAEFLAWYTEPA